MAHSITYPSYLIVDLLQILVSIPVTKSYQKNSANLGIVHPDIDIHIQTLTKTHAIKNIEDNGFNDF